MPDPTNPTPKKAPPDTSWHPRFLELFAYSLNVVTAARGAGVDRSTAYAHKKRFKTFARQWKEAKREAWQRLEAEAYDRAKKQSDTLMIFLLKAHKPKKYRERQEVKLEFGKLSDAELIAQAKGLLGGIVTPSPDSP